jgi:hypothetical protein
MTSFILLNVVVQAQTPADTLDNEGVIALSKIGLQPTVIINKINSSYCSFDVSTDALIDLSKNGVDAQVISTMMDINNAALAQVEMDQNLSNPAAMHNAGIYYYEPTIPDNPLIRLEAFSANNETHSGGYGGFGGSSTYARLNGLSANYKIINNQPVFYFYFPTNTNNDQMFAASSPNDFELVKLKVEKKSRVVKVGGGSHFAYGSNYSASIPDEFKISFTMEKVDEGIYKITIPKSLVVGEYCFVYKNDTSRVFDFSISVK